MTLEKVIENLERTIQGKRDYRDELDRIIARSSPGVERATTHATKVFLDANISELEKILTDLKLIKS